jgi:hypothetical protein
LGSSIGFEQAVKRRVARFCIGLTTVLALVVVFWLNEKNQKRDRSAANDPRHRMFAGNALPGFFFATTDVKPDSTVYTFTNVTSVSKIEVLENIEAPDSSVLVQDGVMGIQALYANALSPYPGDISNKLATDPAYRPRLFQVTNAAVSAAYFLLYSNDRLGYGAATKDSVKFKSLVGWFYCAARKEFFKVKLFVPLTTNDRELEAIFFSLRCSPK